MSTYQIFPNPQPGQHRWSAPSGFATCTACGCKRRLEKKSGGYRTTYGTPGAGPRGGVEWTRSAPTCGARSNPAGKSRVPAAVRRIVAALGGEFSATGDGSEFVFDNHAKAAQAAVRVNIAGYTARTDGIYLRVGGKIRRNPATKYRKSRKPRAEAPIAHVTPSQFRVLRRLHTAAERMDYLVALGFRRNAAGYRVKGDG